MDENYAYFFDSQSSIQYSCDDYSGALRNLHKLKIRQILKNIMRHYDSFTKDFFTKDTSRR